MSGLLAGFIGGLAKGGLDIINTEEAQQRKIEDEARREETTMRAEERRALAEQKRQETLQVLAEQREEKRRQRDAGDMIGANADAEKAVSDRGFEKFKSDLGQTDASPEELRKVYESQYHDKTVGGFQGADRYDIKESEKAKERFSQLQKRGASSGLITSGFNEYKDTVTRERQAELDATKAAKDKVEQERKDREEERKGKVADAQIAKLASGGSGGGSGNSLVREERIRYTTLFENTSRDLREAQKARDELAAQPGAARRNADALKSLDGRIATLQKDRDLYRDMLTNSQTKEREPVEKPAPSASPVNQNDGQSSKRKPPAISSVKGAPAGSSFGSYVEGKGWEVRANGKLVGYAQDKD